VSGGLVGFGFWLRWLCGGGFLKPRAELLRHGFFVFGEPGAGVHGFWCGRDVFSHGQWTWAGSLSGWLFVD